MIAPLNIGAAPVCGGAPGSGSGAAAAEATPAASGCGFGARLEAAAPAPEAAGETTAAEAVEGAPVVVQPVVPAVPGGMAGVPAADVAAEAPLPAATVDQKDAATRLLRAQLFAVAEEAGAPAAPGARLHVWPQALPAGIPVSPVAAGAIPPIAAPAQPAPAAKSPPVAAVASYSVPAAAPHAPRGSPSTPVDGAGQTAATAEANARAPTAEATGGAGPRGALPEGVPAAAAWNNAAPATPAAAVAHAGVPHQAGRGDPAALLELLGGHIQARLQQGVQQAVIRLEPHMAGTVQLEVRHEAGVLRVHLSASHDEVARQLQGIAEGLRQDLAGRQFTEVSVQVGQQRHGDAHGQGRQERGEPQQPARPGRALGDSEEAYSRFAAALRRVNTIGA